MYHSALLTLSDVSSESLLQLSRTCRECTSRMFVFEHQVVSLCRLYCLMRGANLREPFNPHQRIADITDGATRVKSLLCQALQGLVVKVPVCWGGVI